MRRAFAICTLLAVAGCHRADVKAASNEVVDTTIGKTAENVVATTNTVDVAQAPSVPVDQSPEAAPIPEAVPTPYTRPTVNPNEDYAPGTDPSPRRVSGVITNPDWARKPSSDDLAQYYPDRAQRIGKGGAVVMRCSVAATGLLTGCSIVSEDPPDFDFGSATLRVARLFRMKPMTAEGESVEGGTVVIPLRWNPPQ